MNKKSRRYNEEFVLALAICLFIIALIAVVISFTAETYISEDAKLATLAFGVSIIVIILSTNFAFSISKYLHDRILKLVNHISKPIRIIMALLFCIISPFGSAYIIKEAIISLLKLFSLYPYFSKIIIISGIIALLGVGVIVLILGLVIIMAILHNDPELLPEKISIDLNDFVKWIKKNRLLLLLCLSIGTVVAHQLVVVIYKYYATH